MHCLVLIREPEASTQFAIGVGLSGPDAFTYTSSDTVGISQNFVQRWPRIWGFAVIMTQCGVVHVCRFLSLKNYPVGMDGAPTWVNPPLKNGPVRSWIREFLTRGSGEVYVCVVSAKIADHLLNRFVPAKVGMWPR